VVDRDARNLSPARLETVPGPHRGFVQRPKSPIGHFSTLGSAVPEIHRAHDLTSWNSRWSTPGPVPAARGCFFAFGPLERGLARLLPPHPWCRRVFPTSAGQADPPNAARLDRENGPLPPPEIRRRRSRGPRRTRPRRRPLPFATILPLTMISSNSALHWPSSRGGVFPKRTGDQPFAPSPIEDVPSEPRRADGDWFGRLTTRRPL